MFINSKKSFEICEGARKLVIPRGYIGSIPDWAAGHWMIQAAIRDGSIATPENTADRSLERADTEAEKKAEAYDARPNEMKEAVGMEKAEAAVKEAGESKMDAVDAQKTGKRGAREKE